MLQKVDIEEKFALIADYWRPRLAGTVNETAIKLVKVRGEFLWHHHDREDELFLVVRGRLRMRLPDGEVVLEPGEFLIVPRGLEHMPVADEDTWILLVEPASTLNTGNARNERTVAEVEPI